jgi:uncharacterized protein
MTLPDFQRTQFAFAGHLRDPEQPAPPGIEDRRLAVYRELIYNNIEGFIASGFPVLKTLLSEEHWHQLVRSFIRDYRCQTPYFLEISREFVEFLVLRQQQELLESWAPPFMVELAHYEWVELALDVAEERIPDNAGISHSGDVLQAFLSISPLVWRLSYQFPVHRISRDFQPDAPAEEGCHLVVYRNRADKVRFLEVNQFVMKLLQLIGNKNYLAKDVLLELAEETGHPEPAVVLRFGCDLFRQLLDLDILCTVDFSDQRAP